MPSRSRRPSLVRAPRGAAVAVLIVVLAALLGVQVHSAPPANAAEPTPTTYPGPTYPDVGAPPTADKPQSKLWWNDGSWWALMRSQTAVTIHRLSSDQVWHDTGTVVDERLASTGDALWEGGSLYVASRISGSSGALRVLKFSYDATTGAYAEVLRKNVAGGGSESMSIARDSQRRLWVTFTQGSQVYVAHTTTDDATWAAPFPVPVPGGDNDVTSDDISAIIAFGGQIGVMWSDQGDDVMRFAVHPDTAAPGSGWLLENALSGPNWADDHINLKSLLEDDAGRIYAAVKTSRGDGGEPATDPSIVVLQRSVDGEWTWAMAATVADDLTRPQIALDSTNRRLYVLMSDEGGGSVYYKSAPLGALSFPTGTGAPFVQWPGTDINDASTTKQPVNATTGLVVLASDDTAHRYYHGTLSLAGSDTTAPTAPEGVTATVTSASSVALSWEPSTDNVAVTGYRVFRDDIQVGAPSGTSYSDAGLTAGTTYTYTVKAADAAGNLSDASASVQATPGELQAGSISFVGMATATGSGTDTSVAGPAGASTGDLLVAAVSSRGAPTIAAPPGWTEVRVDSNGSTMRQAVFVRPATTDNASTWTLSRAYDHVVQVLAYRGVDTADPVIASAGALSTTATLTHPAVASVDGAQVITVAGIARTTPLEPGAPLTERSEITTDSSARYKLTADAADTTARSTTSGPYTTTANGNSGGVGQTLSLRAGGDTAPPAEDTTAPSVPTGLAATPTSTTSVDLTWTAATDDTGVTGYRVFRDGLQVGTPSGTSYSDTGLTADTTYSYTVAAVDAAGNQSGQSAPATATTPADTVQEPVESGPAQFVSAATATSTTTSTAVASPAGVQAGDVLIAAVAIRGTATITPDAGWTLVRTDGPGSTMRQALYVKVATGSNAASTWTLSRSQTTVVQVLAYRGVDTANPVIASAGISSTTATLTSPAVESATGSPVLSFAAIARTTPLEPGAPLTERSEITSDSSATYKLTADAADTTAEGTTSGPYTTTANGDSGGVAQTLSLRAAG